MSKFLDDDEIEGAAEMAKDIFEKLRESTDTPGFALAVLALAMGGIMKAAEVSRETNETPEEARAQGFKFVCDLIESVAFDKPIPREKPDA